MGNSTGSLSMLYGQTFCVYLIMNKDLLIIRVILAR